MTDIAKYNDKYNLIFSDPNTRAVMEINEAETCPSLTSILQALEDNKHAENLFYTDNSETYCNYLLDSLTNMKEGIDKMKHWLTSNFVETTNCLNSKDLFTVAAKLGGLEDDFKICYLNIQRISKKLDRKLRKFDLKNNKYTNMCSTCGEKLVINKNGGLDELEMHCHIAEVLSRGKILEPFEIFEPQLCSDYLNALENIPLPPAPQLRSDFLNALENFPLPPAPSSNDERNAPNIVATNTIAQDFENTIDITQNYLFSRYCTKVTEVLYPSDMIAKASQIEDNKDFYTIRCRIPNEAFDCLVCLKSIALPPKSMLQHLRGKKHLNKIKNKYEMNRAIHFHNVFSSLVDEYQMHQVMFAPGYKFPFIHCNICYKSIDGTEVVDHIQNIVHKERVVFYKKGCRKLNFYSEIASSFNNSKTTSEASIVNQDSQSNNKVVVENTQLIEDEISDDFDEPSISSAESDDKDFLGQRAQPSKIFFNSALVKKEPKTITSITDETASSTIICTHEVIAKKEHKNIESNRKKSVSSTISSTSNVITGADTIVASTSESTPSTSSQENGVSNDSQKSEVKTQQPLKHNIIPSFKLDPQNMFDSLENRLQAHLEFIDEIEVQTKEGRLHCTLCMQDFPKNERNIKYHITNKLHKKNAKIFLGPQEYIFYCDLCFKNINGENKWEGHLKSNEHNQRLDAIQKNKEPRGGVFMELECTNCKLVMFGNKNTINKHLRGTVTRDKPKKPPKVIKLPNKIVDLLSNEKMFNIDIKKLNNDSEAVLNLLGLSNKCCVAIEKALEPYFGPCKAYPFGSRVSGLGNSISDLDVFVDTGSMYDGEINQDAPSQAQLVKTSAQILRKHKDFIEVCPIPLARTPIVQVLHRVTGLDCDLSFRHGLSVENTEYLRLCISVQPKMKSLILFVKKWASMCLSHKISTYALSMMAIFFMQTKGLVPSVQQLREIDPTEPNVIAGWKTFSFNKPIFELAAIFPSTDMSIRDLLQDYFEFYIKFPFKTEVVCPLLGRTVPKVDFHQEKAKHLPEDMAVYVERINSSADSEVFRSNCPMCVQDPFDLSHNLTKSVSGDTVVKFITLSKLSSVLLTKPKSIS